MKQNTRGFTLIEIMVVVVIIGLLAAFVGPEVWKMLGWGQASIAEAKCKDYHDKAKTWEMMTKQKVTSLDDMESPLRSGEENFLRIEDDPWGQKYWLLREGAKVVVWSAGPDGQEGTDDDIRYPKDDE